MSSQPETENSKKVLIISHDVVGTQMAGPGIRYYELARVLAAEFTVTLAVPGEVDPDLEQAGLRLISYRRGEWDSLEKLVEGAAAIIMNSVTAGELPQLSQIKIPIAIDGYDPLLAEWLAMTQFRPDDQEEYWWQQMVRLGRQYLLGDFFVCASERQRDWWLGLLEAHGRVNPWTLRQDPGLRKLVDIVPFGLPAEPPKPATPKIKGVWPGIQPEDRLILWGGGLWLWMDPLTAIRALGKVWQVRQDVRLVFPGTHHPNPAMAQVPTHLAAARQEAVNLGLLNQGVFFGDWVSYSDWPGILLESDLALSLHFEDTLETRWAFRTRVLDYIWASLPMVATRGDATSEIITAYQLGLLTAGGDIEGVASGLLEILETPRQAYQAQFQTARQQFTWERVAGPLLAFCRDPRRAPDKDALGDLLGAPVFLDETRQLRQTLSQLELENRLAHDRIAQIETENRRLNELVHAFEKRKIVRFLNWLRTLRKN